MQILLVVIFIAFVVLGVPISFALGFVSFAGIAALPIIPVSYTHLDFRGITLNMPSDLIGLTEFEQYEDSGTDTVIYSFNKMVKLLLECNPNTCEILGLDHDQYLIKSRLGQELLDNRNLFLSKRAAKSFGGYASAQLRRLQNAIADVYKRQNRRYPWTI